jgi:ABC-2 type transport system permease protein
MSIYGKVVRIIGIYIVPVFVIANYPSMYIMNKLHTGDIIWAIIAVSAAFCIARWIFNRGIQRYESTGS